MIRGSGNVFSHLGLANAHLVQARAILAAKIIQVLGERKAVKTLSKKMQVALNKRPGRVIRPASREVAHGIDVGVAPEVGGELLEIQE